MWKSAIRIGKVIGCVKMDRNMYNTEIYLEVVKVSSCLTHCDFVFRHPQFQYSPITPVRGTVSLPIYNGPKVFVLLFV